MNTVLRVLLILACFELGILLLFAPWTGFWEQNYFINRFPALIPILLHPSARGLISGLGILDIILAAGMIRRRPASPVAPHT
jgi:hypothetical protein